MSDAPPPIPDFTLFRPIGRGAYGEVWLARSVTGLYRAVKIVRRASFGDERPFEREFAGLKRFEPISAGQESQVGLLHVGRNEAEGFFYYVMELADDVETGEEIFPDHYVPKTLTELRTRQHRLSTTECLDIGLALTRALAHLHANGLVHRDIKPSNVIFVHGVPKLADIGLVSTIDTSHSFVGTEGFVPPEGPGTATADIFSLGKVLYEISTGRDRNDFPNLPEDLETMPERRALLELNEIILKACDRNAGRRYSSAAAMREDLLLVQAGRSVRQLHLTEKRLRFIAKYGVAATFISALAIAGFLWASAQTRKANENFQRAERAENEAKSRLHEANFNLVRANRLAGRTGFRFNSLPELAKAAAYSNRLDYRNEAIACLALPDLRPLKQWAKTPYWDSFNFTPDFRSYGTNDLLGNIFIRDTATDELRHTLVTQGAPLTGSATSRDGRLIATSDTFERAWLWTLGIETPAGLPFSPKSTLIGFTTDNAHLMVRSGDNALEFINVTNGVVEQTLADLPPFRSVQINPAIDQLLLIEANRVHIHRRSDGSRVRTFSLPDTVSASAWHPDGLRFAVVWGKSIGVYEVTTGKQCALGVGHESAIVGLTFDESGDWLASASWDRTTRLWRADTVREVARLNVSGNGLQLSADGRRLAFRSWDHTKVQLFELSETDVAQRFHVPGSHFTHRVVFHPDGQWLVAVDELALSLFRPPLTAPVDRMEIAGTANVAFLSEGRALITAGGRGLRRWPVSFNQADDKLVIGPREVVENTYLKTIQHMIFSGDERWCVAVSRGTNSLFAFELGQTNRVVPFFGDTSYTHLHSVNKDGTLASTRNDRHPKQVQLWNPQTGRFITSLATDTPFRDSAISPDNRWLAVSAIGSTTLWALDSLQPRHRIAHPDVEENRYALAFSPDNRTLAVAVSDCEIWLIDVDTGATIAALPVDRMVSSLSFNAAGNTLAVAGEGSWFELWDLHLLRTKLATLNLDWPDQAVKNR